jgi:hypothetical protein
MTSDTVIDEPRAQYGGDVKTLGAATRNFLTRRSPWLILAAIAAVAAGRIALGDFGWGDVVAVAAMLVIYPFGEWAIHVYLLHMKRWSTIASRAHRVHHKVPNDLDQLLLSPWQVAGLLSIAAEVVALGGLITWLAGGSVPWGPLLSGLLTAYVLILGYEWTHLLIHTAYVPKSAAYRRVWRNHRLHHFKNENFWHGVTNNLSDRVLGTNPDQREVERSATARTLESGPTG